MVCEVDNLCLNHAVFQLTTVAVCVCQGVVTKMAKHVNGTRHHMVSFEPWPGGPSTTTSWNFARKRLALCPSGISSGGASVSGTRGAGAASASRSGGTAKGAGAETAAAEEAAATQEEEKEEEGTKECGAARHTPPNTENLPAGTVVVVRSVETDPGRTLKFARDETYEAGFQEVLGREVSLGQHSGSRPGPHGVPIQPSCVL